jgi:hypothetical protein
MGIAIAVLSGFGLATSAPFLYRLSNDKAGWMFAALPLGLAIYFATFIPAVISIFAVFRLGIEKGLKGHGSPCHP